MPVVPMFHANAWGLPYGCLMAGADIVLPGPRMTPPAIVELLSPAQGHGHRRGADDLDGRAAAARPSTTCPRCG